MSDESSAAGDTPQSEEEQRAMHQDDQDESGPIAEPDAMLAAADPDSVPQDGEGGETVYG